MAKANAKITDLIADDKNFNQHNQFGNSLVEKSIQKFGMGRSILIDKNNKIIAGNATVENAGSVGMEDVQIVESDGKRIIAVKRTDIDLDSPEGREMALADNASAKANIVMDAELIEAELGEAICEEWGVELGNSSDNGKIKKENLEPFQKTHILLSFHPQLLLKIQSHLQNIIDTECVEYERAATLKILQNELSNSLHHLERIYNGLPAFEEPINKLK